MVRPKVDEETVQALNQVCRPHFRADVEDLAFDTKLQFLLEHQQELSEQVQQQQSQSQQGSQPFNDLGL